MSAAHPFQAAGLGTAPYRCVGYAKVTYQACPGAPVQVGGACDYCGTGIVHQYLVVGETGPQFKVGSECVRKVDRVLAREMRGARTTYEREARGRARKGEREARERARRAVFAAQPWVMGVAILAAFGEDRIATGIIERASDPTPRQWEAMFRRALRIQAELTDRARGVAQTPCPTGRVELRGRVLKVEDRFYGHVSRRVILVADERGFKAWGTCPRALWRVGSGDRVQFMATVERKDSGFGFFKRPVCK